MLLASRIVSLVGGAGFFVASFFPWYWGESDGFRRTENAWQGEESLMAVLCVLLAMTLIAVGGALPKTWLPVGILQLILVIACLGLTIFHILHNSQPVVVYGRTIPTGIGAGPWVGILASVVMIVGSILNLCSGGPLRLAVEDYEDDDEEDRPRRPRPRRRRDWD